MSIKSIITAFLVSSTIIALPASLPKQPGTPAKGAGGLHRRSYPMQPRAPAKGAGGLHRRCGDFGCGGCDFGCGGCDFGCGGFGYGLGGYGLGFDGYGGYGGYGGCGGCGDFCGPIVAENCCYTNADCFNCNDYNRNTEAAVFCDNECCSNVNSNCFENANNNLFIA